MNKTKKYAYLAVFCALAIVINLVENIFIPPLSFGIRFGLANIISLITLKLMGVKEMCLVLLLRLTLGNLLNGTIFGTPFWISSLGIILSAIIIILLNKINASIIFTSMMSSIFHTLGQVIVVCYIYGEINIIVLLPVLIISSLATGILTGLLSLEVIKRIKL